MKRQDDRIGDVIRFGSLNGKHRAKFCVIVGAATCFPEPNVSLKLDQIGDGPENTLLVIEHPAMEAEWRDPVDLGFSDLIAWLDSCFAKDSQVTPYLLFADGKVFRLTRRPSLAIAQALATAI
jgi:hypothetical protein